MLCSLVSLCKWPRLGILLLKTLILVLQLTMCCDTFLMFSVKNLKFCIKVRTITVCHAITMHAGVTTGPSAGDIASISGTPLKECVTYVHTLINADKFESALAM